MQYRKTMLTVTTDTVAAREIVEVLGLVQGNTIQTGHIGSHIIAVQMTIVGMRYASSQIMNGGVEILVYGTAVKLA